MKRQKRYICTPVEKVALEASAYKILYPPVEKIPTIVVRHFPLLGKLTALRFIEWVQQHPGGTVSLPTGKTPEYFIRWVNRLMRGWNRPNIKRELEQCGIDPAVKPDMRSLSFVQIDEFYPIHSAQTNSFSHYVRKYYLRGFGMDEKKALLIDPCKIGVSDAGQLDAAWPDKNVDLTLRYRHPKTHLEEKQKPLLERIDQWCMEYEDKIRELGGIGFFLGGIGPDGHIGFNISGSDHNSTTRLCPTNYETQAAAAVDLGGIEIARKCHVITIGLRTITRNADCAAVIMAAGQTKAQVVARAVQSEKDVRLPATALQALKNARFYITEGAAKGLIRRQYEDILNGRKPTDRQIEQILVDICLEKNRRLTDLKTKDIEKHHIGGLILRKRTEPASVLVQNTVETLRRKISAGLEPLENTCFLHTEPHHDDIMLGYFGYIVRHFRKASNSHHFMTLTSGFTAVTNHFMLQQIQNLRQHLNLPTLRSLYRQGYFDRNNITARNRDVWQYLDGVSAANQAMKNEGCARRFLRNLMEAYNIGTLKKGEQVLEKLEKYFQTHYPGGHDAKDIRQLKGVCREWEAECLWGYYGWKCDNVHHMRLGFYTGDIFTPQPTQKRDVMPIVRQMEKIRPDIVTVAMDPEASGPDTHYKALQAVAEALRIYQERSGRTDIRIWGYRNVWYRFDMAEADIFVPVSLNMFSIMQQSFENAFLSQKEASFPSYEYDGPFSHLAQQIQVRQYQALKTCLGRQWFYNHTSPLIRATRGLIFLRQMEPQEFYASCRKLRKSIEDCDR